MAWLIISATLLASTATTVSAGTDSEATLADLLQDRVAGAPGTYFYWGSTTHQPVDTRNGIDSQLHGAFVIDSTATPSPDRIFVLGSWTGRADSSGFAPDLRVNIP